ncbi:MAG: TonB-dependent receptor [Proteobacteria bacterium]|nr:TonB-dependent receptor [Pseudomonadota bacterium]
MLLFSMAHPAGAAATPAEPPLVSEVLAQLRRTGIRLIYSSQEIPPGLRARNAVQGTTVAQRLRSLLEPLHLQARPLAGGGYVIVPESASAPARPRRRREAAPVVLPLEQVVVQTSRYETSVSAGVTAGREALENSPETHNDAVRALQVIPGTTAAGYTARTHVRGSQDDEVLFRYDGVTLHEPFHLKELQSLFSAVDPMAVDSVTAWTGIAPIEYGGKIGGVVQMRPRRITRSTVDLQLSQQGASAMLGTTVDRGRGTVFADLRLQNQYAPVGWIDTGVGRPTLNDLIVHGTWRVGTGTRLAAGVLAIDDHRKYFSTEAAQSKGVAGGEYYEWLRFDHRFSAAVSSVTLLSGEQSHENVSGLVNEPNIVTGQLFEHSSHTIYTLRQELRGAPATRWVWHAGAEATSITLADRSSGYAAFSAPFFPDLQPSASVLADESIGAQAVTYALYGSLRWRATRRTAVDLGVRRDARRFRDGPADAQWNVRANVREALTPRTTLRLGWGQESQADVLDPRMSGGRVVPTPARRLSQTDFGLDHRFAGGAAARAELYYKDEGSAFSQSTDLFSPFALLPELAVDGVRVTSLRSRMYGAELSLTSDPSRALSGSVSYVWSRAEDRIAGLWVPRAWDEPNAVKLNVLWRQSPFTVAAALTWHSGWPYTPLLASSSTWTDPAAVRLAFAPLNSARLGSFFTTDLRIAWQRRLGVGEFQAFLNVYDLTDAHSICCRSYSVTRSPDGIYRLVTTGSPWLNLTPVLGVRWHY